jgi:tetratricopeptide (TPR) repeat protein
MLLDSLLRLTAAGLILLSADASAKKPPTADETARKVFEAGEREYAVGRYKEAAVAFEEAYRLSNRAELLFNLGNTYERMGQRRKAAAYLVEFLQRSRDALTREDLISLQGRITRLWDAAAAEEAKAKAERERATAKARALEEARREVERAKHEAMQARWERDRAALRQSSAQINWPGWVFTGAGVTGAGTAIALGVLLSDAKNRVDKSCNASNDGVLCQSSGADAIRDQQAYAAGVDIATAVGVVGVGLALYFFLTGDEPEPAGSQVQLFLGEDSAGLGLMGSF